MEKILSKCFVIVISCIISFILGQILMLNNLVTWILIGVAIIFIIILFSFYYYFYRDIRALKKNLGGKLTNEQMNLIMCANNMLKEAKIKNEKDIKKFLEVKEVLIENDVYNKSKLSKYIKMKKTLDKNKIYSDEEITKFLTIMQEMQENKVCNIDDLRNIIDIEILLTKNKILEREKIQIITELLRKLIDRGICNGEDIEQILHIKSTLNENNIFEQEKIQTIINFINDLSIMNSCSVSELKKMVLVNNILNNNKEIEIEKLVELIYIKIKLNKANINELDDLNDRIELLTNLDLHGIVKCSNELENVFVKSKCASYVQGDLAFMGVTGNKWVTDRRNRSQLEEILTTADAYNRKVQFLLINPKGESFKKMKNVRRSNDLTDESYSIWKELIKQYSSLDIRLYDHVASFRLHFVKNKLAVSQYKFEVNNGWKTQFDTEDLKSWHAPYLIIHDTNTEGKHSKQRHYWSLFHTFSQLYDHIWNESKTFDEVFSNEDQSIRTTC